MAQYSVSPAGEKFLIPEQRDWPAEFDRLTKLVEQARDENKEIVGFAVRVEDLTAEESIGLQEAGIGGRRRFGCGVFIPASGF